LLRRKSFGLGLRAMLPQFLMALSMVVGFTQISGLPHLPYQYFTDQLLINFIVQTLLTGIKTWNQFFCHLCQVCVMPLKKSGQLLP
jgi:hypothetical protein